jgi:calcium-dependent protein kinase
LKKVFGDVKGNMYQDIMRSLDKNCNGYIDYSEFLVAASDKNKLVSSNSLRMAFNMMDKDGNGTIDRAELKDVFD